MLGGLFVLWLADPGARHAAVAQQEPLLQQSTLQQPILQQPPGTPGPRLPGFDGVSPAPPGGRSADLVFNADGLTPEEAIGVAVYDRNNKGVVNITTKSVEHDPAA